MDTPATITTQSSVPACIQILPSEFMGIIEGDTLTKDLGYGLTWQITLDDNIKTYVILPEGSESNVQKESKEESPEEGNGKSG